MPVRVLQCVARGHEVLVESSSVADGGADGTLCLVSGESIQFDGPPQALELDLGEVFGFDEGLAKLGQGVTGLAYADSKCLPIVTADYFSADRAPAVGVRHIDRTQAPAPAQPANEGSRRFFVFGVPGAAGFQVAVSMNQVLEVSRSLPLALFNFEHSQFAGGAIWRGDTIPVIDLALAARLGTMRDEAWARMMIVRNASNRIFAIPAVGQVRQPAAAAQVYTPDSGSVRPMRGIRGVFRFEGSPLLVPDLDALVD